MTKRAKELLNKLYVYTDTLAAYNRYLSTDECDAVFLCIRDVLLFIKTDDGGEDYESILKRMEQLDSLVDFAVDGEQCS